MARKKSLKSTAKELAKELKQELGEVAEENKQRNSEMMDTIIGDLEEKETPPKISLM